MRQGIEGRGYDMIALQETHVPHAQLDDVENDLVKMGYKATFTAARDSSRSAAGTQGGTAVISKGHLRVTSFRHLAQARQVSNATADIRRDVGRE
eukprot:2901093-Pyramimonas_sp.AAC.2